MESPPHADEPVADAPHDAPAPEGLLRLYEHSKLQQAKKELISRLLPEQCTFAPHINKRPAPAAAAGAEGGEGGVVNAPVHERLHQHATTRQERRAESPAAEFTFVPTITKRAQQLKDKGELGGKHTTDVLYEKGMARKAELVDIRAKAALDGCSFKPKITAKAERLVRTGAIGDRLYDPVSVARRREPGHNDPWAPLADGATFHPSVNKFPAKLFAAGGTGEGSPRASAAAAGEGGVGGEGEAPLPRFSAAVSPAGAAAATGSPRTRLANLGVTAPGSGNDVSPFERLHRRAMERKATLEAQRALQYAEELAACTFRPNTALSSLSHPMPLRSSIGGSPGDGNSNSASRSAFDRLYGDAQGRAERSAALAAAVPPVDAACTFEPALSHTTRRITERLPRGSGQSPAEAPEADSSLLPRHLQLYADGLVKQRERRELANLLELQGGPLRPEEFAQMTFQPQLRSRRAPPASAAVSSPPSAPVYVSISAAVAAAATTAASSSPPALAATSGSAVDTSVGIVSPSKVPVHERLYVDATVKQEAAAAAAAAAEASPKRNGASPPSTLLRSALQTSGSALLRQILLENTPGSEKKGSSPEPAIVAPADVPTQGAAQ